MAAPQQPKSLFRSLPLQIFTVILLAQGLLFYSAARKDYVPSNAPLIGLPFELNAVKDEQIDTETRDVLKADDLLSRYYLSPSGDVNLFIAYFKSQRTGQSPHSPKNRLPGSGYQPSQSGKTDILAGGETITINHYLVSRGDISSLVLYWYQSQGRVIADEFAAKFYLVLDSIQKHRSDTALVRVVTGVPSGGEAQAEARAQKFVKDFYPVVKSYLPN
jgi:EpsI family protein